MKWLVFAATVVPLLLKAPALKATDSEAAVLAAAPSALDVAIAIETELKTARVPGAAIAIVSGEDVVARGYGVANVETGAPMDAGTVVHLGSLTKLFTALAVTTSLEREKLTPDATVGTYVRGLSPRASSATFHQLLSQTSGLRDRAGDYGSDAEAELVNAARELTDQDFLLPAGTVFSYSNLGYALAGAGLEGLRKRPYSDVMRDAVFTPLGMSRSTLRLSAATAGPHAVGHKMESEKPVVVRPLANDTRIWPAGYMWSSATDMSRALVALMHQGRVGGKEVLPADAVARVMNPQTPMPNVFVGGHYGYGLMIARDRDVLMYEHGGTLPGFSSILRFAPERGLGIAILTNLDNAPLRRIAQNVMAQVLALPAPTPPQRTETAVTPEEMKPLLGRYRNLGTVDLATREGRVVLILNDGAPMTVGRIGPNRFIAHPAPNVPGPEFVLEPTTDAARAYLHFALWAYVREN